MHCTLQPAASSLVGPHTPPAPSPQAAPYKRRGTIPFGVQRGSYGLTAEEKMRRAARSWSSAGSGGGAASLLEAADAPPSFGDLVSSFRRVVADGGAPEVDVRDLVGDAALVPEALALSKESVIEWMEAKEAAASDDKQFVFKVKAP